MTKAIYIDGCRVGQCHLGTGWHWSCSPWVSVLQCICPHTDLCVFHTIGHVQFPRGFRLPDTPELQAGHR